jgi:nucleotide-binding universal stress UspA family protein
VNQRADSIGPEREGQMSGVVVGIDGSHNSSNALDWAMAEAALRNADLTVITVNSVPASYWSRQPVPLAGDAERVEKIRKAAQDAVDKAAAALGDRQPKSVTVAAISGFPAQTLIETSAGADLMVVGSRGGGGFGELFLGSICSQVVHHAKCPVVVVPTGR